MAASAPGERNRTLAGIEIFRDTRREDLERIEQRCRWRRYQPGQAVIERDAPTHEVHFVAAGTVRVEDHAASGRVVSFQDVRAGGLVGELAAIDGGERSASVIAVEPTTTAALDPRSFLNILADHPEVSLATMQRLADMVRQASTRIMELSTVGAHNRVHAEVLRIARERAGRDGASARISPIPAHADIASRVSTTRETVARVLSELGKQGLVRRERNALVVPDLAALTELVERARAE